MNSGETNLNALLKTLKPVLNTGEFVFCFVRELTEAQTAACIMSFQEEEGTTLIIPRWQADRLKLPYTFVGAWITLTVHSSLHAVGLTAAFSHALAKQGISCNVVAAFHHDHIFVDYPNAEAAMEILKELSR